MRVLIAVGSWVCICVMGMTQTVRGRNRIILPAPPLAKAIPVVDDYFGTKVADNYRWLEDPNSADTHEFIDAENAYTKQYLTQVKIRPEIAAELNRLNDVTLTSVPIERSGNLYFLRRLTGEQHRSIYIRRGWTGKDERLIAPDSLGAADISLTITDVSVDGSLIAYEVGKGGADEHTIRVFDANAKKNLPDELPANRYFGLCFAPDGKSFYYAINSKDGSSVLQHVLGTPSSEDLHVFGHEYRGEQFGANDLFAPYTTDDSRYLVIEIDHGVPATRVDVVFRSLTKSNAPFEALVWSVGANFSADYAHDRWFVKTDYKAPKGRIMAAEPGVSPDNWKTIVPEASDVIQDWNIVGDKIYVNYLKDVKSATSAYELDGRLAGHIDYGTLGTASTRNGRSVGRYGFYSFESLTVPPVIYRLDTQTGNREIFFRPKIPFDPTEYEVAQVFYKSDDGTRIPMFIAGKKGLRKDSTERLLMHGYGGFQVSLTATWNPVFAWWIQQGGWFAEPALRGGGEYGESWHQQAMLEKKQNTFDDWFSAARYLIGQKYTSPERFAITGRSNGGLLMGAALAQHPELFSAVWCSYPLLDMLRYQRFMLGRYWTNEYGSSESEKQLPFLLKYSPYQNIKPKTPYPAVIITSDDHDTSHDALHARKMAALLQTDSSSGRPILLHYGISKDPALTGSFSQYVQDSADALAFLWNETDWPDSLAIHVP